MHFPSSLFISESSLLRPYQAFLSLSLRALLTFPFFLLAMVYKLGAGAPALVTALVFLLILLPPGVTCNALTNQKTHDLITDMSFAPLNRKLLVFAKFTITNVYNVVFIVLSIIFMYIRYNENVGILQLLKVGLALILLNFTLASLSMSFSLVLNRILSFALSYLLSCALLSNIFLCGALVERLSDQGVKNLLTTIAMHTNPAIMVLRSLGKIDILRTQYLYNLADPIVGRGFSYPEPYVCWAIYFGLLILINSLNLIFANRYFRRQI